MFRRRISLMPLLAGGLLALTAVAGAQQTPEAQEVPRYVERQMPPAWYREQAERWKQVLARTPADADAWLNYYKAVRYSGFGDTTISEERKMERQQKVAEEIGRAMPDSWVFHYVTWWSGGNNDTLFPHLQRAYELHPDDSQMADDFLTYYEMKGEHALAATFARKWYDSRSMSPSLLDYNYNVLASLDSNAVIFTVGDNDTYPIWLLQRALGIRPDVTVLNVSLLLNSDYRQRVMKENDIKGDGSLIDWERFSKKPYEECVADFLASVAHSTGRPVYFALTVDTAFISKIRDDLYTTGLANRYSARRIDNVAILERNWKRFRLDYLKLRFYDGAYLFNQELMPMLNMNYVMPAMLLYEHHLLAGNTAAAAELKSLIREIGRQGEQAEPVDEYLRSVEGSATASFEENGSATSSTSRLEREAKVFPNPTYSRLTVTIPAGAGADAELMTMDGRSVKRFRLDGGQTTVDISGVAAGTYMLTIRAEGETVSRTVKVVR